MQLKNEYSKGIRYLLCAINIYSKYVCVVPLKDREVIAITKDFKEVLDESKGCKKKQYMGR